jgi:hypothetical protein
MIPADVSGGNYGPRPASNTILWRRKGYSYVLEEERGPEIETAQAWILFGRATVNEVMLGNVLDTAKNLIQAGITKILSLYVLCSDTYSSFSST